MRIASVCMLMFLVQPVLLGQEANRESNSQTASLADEQWYSPEFWQAVDGSPPQKSWQFEQGSIRLVKPRGGKGHLISPPVPTNFQLEFKFNYAAKTNSGLKYRVRKFGNRWLGVEYQIIDDYGKGPPNKNSSASIYDLFAASPDLSLNPSGEWNAAKIVAHGPEIKHYLNGMLVNSARVGTVAWNSAIAKSKFYGNPKFGHPVQGDRIMLTDHGGQVAYKDFRFTELPKEEEELEAPTAPQLGNAIRNSWADQDSIVLWTRTTKQAEMTKGPQFLTVDRKLGDQYPKSVSADELLSKQLPEGKKLDEMLGACPGAPGEVRLTYFPVEKRKAMFETEWVATDANSDYTTQWKLENLMPGTEYAAIVEARPVGGEAITAVLRGAFETAPAAKKPSPVTFCMTTCHDFERRDDGEIGHKIYPAMTEISPNFVVHAGDIEYYDKPHPWAWTKELMRFKWSRIFSMPRNREFYANTSTYFIKDDHDTLKNDCWAGQSYGTVSFEEGLRIFNEEQFPTHPTRYETISWGKDLQIWVLEGRDYRSANNAPDGPEKSILGKEQREWLFNTLEASTARFKLVFSPTPIVGPDRKNKKDNHANTVFAFEGEMLREKFSEIEGLIVFCGDRHWQYASVDSETQVWEFGCGPGSEKHQLGWKKGDERPVHRFLRVAGGFLSGSLSYDDNEPKLVIKHHTVNGKEVSSFTFPEASE